MYSLDDIIVHQYLGFSGWLTGTTFQFCPKFQFCPNRDYIYARSWSSLRKKVRKQTGLNLPETHATPRWTGVPGQFYVWPEKNESNRNS